MNINFAGRWQKNEGYGLFTYKFFEQLNKLPDWSVMPMHLEMFNDWEHEHFRAAGYDLNRPLLLIHPPDLNFLTYVPGRVWCFTMFEGTALPPFWVENINRFTERLLVPSKFCADLFERMGVSKPIHVIPGGIDPTLPIYKEVIDRPYTFMALADRWDRKGYDIAWSAFHDVFGSSPDVRLILKMRQDPEGTVNLLSEDGSDYRISLFKSDIKKEKDIYANIDCFVFPTRGEGYGLPPREAAACGIPTICTAWSGTDDAANWAFPIIKYKLVKSHLDKAGEAKWAEPDYDQLKELMLYCYKEREFVKQAALRKAQWLRENATWEIAAKKLAQLFEETLVYKEK